MTIVKNSLPPKRGRGRPRAFDRTEVLERAARTFWAHGYEGASIADLTTAMGITPQSLYAAFGSKEALFREALAWYQQHIGEAAVRILENDPDVVRALTGILELSARAFAGQQCPKGCMISTALLQCAQENEAVAQQVAQMRSDAITLFRSRIENEMAAGQLKSDTDADALARFVGAMIQGMSVQAHDGATAADLEAVVALAARTLELCRPSEPAG